MDDVAVLVFGFLSNVILKLLDPCFTFFPAAGVSKLLKGGREACGLLSGVKHVVKNNATAGHVNINR